ncbi:MAG: hypothetical protein HKN33_14555 [Pyrinomonadaceae bacterium]|nr:hypothetical protein [Pyrinomonadaceae bacterium]
MKNRGSTVRGAVATRREMVYRRGRKVRGGVELGESADLELFLFDAKRAMTAKDATRILALIVSLRSLCPLR